MLVTTTGVPQAKASITTKAKPSYLEDKTVTSAILYNSLSSVCVFAPRKKTFFNFKFFANSSYSLCNIPSPAISVTIFSFSYIFAAFSNISIPFT